MNYNRREMMNSNLNKYTNGIQPISQAERHEQSPITIIAHGNGPINSHNHSYDQPARHLYPNPHLGAFNISSQFANYPRHMINVQDSKAMERNVLANNSFMAMNKRLNQISDDKKSVNSLLKQKIKSQSVTQQNSKNIQILQEKKTHNLNLFKSENKQHLTSQQERRYYNNILPFERKSNIPFPFNPNPLLYDNREYFNNLQSQQKMIYPPKYTYEQGYGNIAPELYYLQLLKQKNLINNFNPYLPPMINDRFLYLPQFNPKPNYLYAKQKLSNGNEKLQQNQQIDNNKDNELFYKKTNITTNNPIIILSDQQQEQKTKNKNIPTNRPNHLPSSKSYKQKVQPLRQNKTKHIQKPKQSKKIELSLHEAKKLRQDQQQMMNMQRNLQKPSISYHQKPTISYHQKPTTSYHQKQTTSYHQKQTTSYNFKPAIPYHKKANQIYLNQNGWIQSQPRKLQNQLFFSIRQVNRVNQSIHQANKVNSSIHQVNRINQSIYDKNLINNKYYNEPTNIKQRIAQSIDLSSRNKSLDHQDSKNRPRQRLPKDIIIQKDNSGIDHIKKQAQKAFVRSRNRKQHQSKTASHSQIEKKQYQQQKATASLTIPYLPYVQKLSNQQIIQQKSLFIWTNKLKRLRQLIRKRDNDAQIMIGCEFQADIPKYINNFRQKRILIAIKRNNLLSRFYRS